MSETEAAKVVLATNNPKKLTELRQVVEDAQLDLDVLGLDDFERYPEPLETERTFEGNALIKARAAAHHTGLPALADDSGLEVDELNGCPGVRSSRWAGPECDDQANNDLLLRQMDGVPGDRRTARFVCAMAFVVPDGNQGVKFSEAQREAWEGRLGTEPHGENGFGYDPLFLPDDAPEVDGHRLTSAELEPDLKNQLSHRGKAVRMVLPTVVGLLGKKMPTEQNGGEAEAIEPTAGQEQG